jgi:hypothetical protein
VFSQSFAVLTLDRTAAGAPATAVTYLAAAACADGGYPLAPSQRGWLAYNRIKRMP